MTKKYFIAFFAVLAVCGGYLAINFAIVFLAGETTPYAEIANWQQKASDRLYDPIFNNDHVSYKYNLFEQRGGQVVVAGSSRALQHREAFYSQPMTNMGRAIAGVKDALRFFKYMENQPQVHTIIFIADFWWFKHRLKPDQKLGDLNYSYGSERSIDMFFLPVYYALQDKFDIGKIVDTASFASGIQDRKTPHIGLRSIQHHIGFKPDGSRWEGSSIFTQEHTDSLLKAQMEKRIGAGRFGYSKKVQTYAIDRFFKGVAELERTGKDVIVVFSPLSPMLYNEVMTNPKFSYVPDTLEYMRNYPIYNYLDPAQFNVESRHFIDFFHTGPYIEAKMLLDLARKDRRAQNVIDAEFLTRFVESNALYPEAME